MKRSAESVSFRAGKSMRLLGVMALLCLGFVSGCGDDDTQSVNLTEDEIEQAERRAVERLKELGCKVEYAEDPWLKTSGIMVKLYPEHITDEGRIRDELFIEFRYLRRLFLLVDSTPIQPDGLGQLRGLDNLLLLSASNTYTDSSGLEKIEGIVSLRLLRLNRSQITDDSLRHIERMPELVMLYLSRTKVTDKAVQNIVNLKRITALQLAHTAITNSGVAELTALKELTHLGLDGTQITDDSIPSLLKFQSLEFLDLSETAITSDGLKKLLKGLPECTIQKLDPASGTAASRIPARSPSVLAMLSNHSR